MAERDKTRTEILFSDVPGDTEKVRAILAEWGVAESSVRRLLNEQRPALPIEAALSHNDAGKQSSKRVKDK